MINLVKKQRKYGLFLESSCLVIDMLKQFQILILSSFFILLLHLEFKGILWIPSWRTFTFSNHSKLTKNEKDMGFETRKG
jgi:hypothetical protein